MQKMDVLIKRWLYKKEFVQKHRTRGQCYKTFYQVIYCHSIVIPSFCVIKLHYLGNYHGMAVNYLGIKLFYIIGQKSLL